MGKRTEFLYMSEPDCIAAGVLDAGKCVNNAEEVFRLLAQGDYLMGEITTIIMECILCFPRPHRFPICLWRDRTGALWPCRHIWEDVSISVGRNGMVPMRLIRRRDFPALY